MNLPKLMLIVDSTSINRLQSIKTKCLIQLRDKNAESETLYRHALHLRQLSHKLDCKLIINDRMDIALAVEADGVHFPEKGLPPRVAKKLHRWITGVSTHSLESALQAEQQGADYIIFGPIYKTGNKIAQGIDMLEKIVSRVSLPVYAIGGITLERCQECFNAGAYGVAGISILEGVLKV